MRKILVVGVGAGDPDHLTVQAIDALNRVDVFFLLDKGPSKAALIELRREICRRYIRDRRYRFVDADSPDWRRDAADYLETVDRLNRDKQAVFEHLISEKMAEGECGAFLVWGDPTLYDSTIRNLEAVRSGGKLAFDYEVIPGISSVQALAAKHKISLNRIGEPVAITTGRKLAQAFPEGADSVVVMLDAHNSFKRFIGQGLQIYWGAYIGTPDEILISGKLDDVAEAIIRARAEARQSHGWIMDIYLMRRDAPE
jgi:precorrin-6A synthase